MTDTEVPTKRKPKRRRKAKGAGRPKGAKTAEAPTVETEPARCRKCDGTEWEILKKLPSTHYHGVHGGRPYSRIDRRRARCINCRSVHILRTYNYSPQTEIPNDAQ